MVHFTEIVDHGAVFFMPWAKGLFERLWEHLGTPKVSEQELDERLQRFRKELPEPVFWLLGKAQSGKTSIIRSLTGTSRAQIGNGFRPCTRTAELYPFPSDTQHFVQFLDTRGLGEVAYDPSEDMRVLEEQAHCVIVVVKAMDHALAAVLDPVAQICRKHPQWPVIVVQTCLHEGYSGPEHNHVLPYPYGANPPPPTVPENLVRSLAAQREAFASLKAQFVPVDFTLPEDEFQPEHYGLDALWAAIEDAIPLGLRAILEENRRSLRDIYFRTAHPHIVSYSLMAGVAAGVPVPLVDIPLIVGIQAKLFHSIASIYGQPMTSTRMAEILSTLGVGFAARLGSRELFKLVPGFGSAVAALFAGASTYALGCTLCAYFSYALDGDVPDVAQLRKLYESEYEEGRKRLRAYLEQLARKEEARSWDA
jgi:uncharacterized protein (DUF697 family)/predicted GTPase